MGRGRTCFALAMGAISIGFGATALSSQYQSLLSGNISPQEYSGVMMIGLACFIVILAGLTYTIYKVYKAESKDHDR